MCDIQKCISKAKKARKIDIYKGERNGTNNNQIDR